MQPEQGNNVQPDYDFIMNSAKPRRFSVNIGNSSPIKRILIVIGGFFVLLMIFIVIKGLFSSSSINTTSYLSVLQDQQEILHILTTDSKSQSALINSANQAFSETAILTLNSYQTSLLNYLSKNGVKVGTSALNGKISTSIDSQFTSALSVNNFNSIFENVLSQQLVSYNSDIKAAYSLNSGAIGRSILQSQYKGTQLLIHELNQQYS